MLTKFSLQETVNKKNNIASNYRASLRRFFLTRFYCTLPSSNDANQKDFKWKFSENPLQTQTIAMYFVCDCCLSLLLSPIVQIEGSSHDNNNSTDQGLLTTLHLASMPTWPKQMPPKDLPTQFTKQTKQTKSTLS